MLGQGKLRRCRDLRSWFGLLLSFQRVLQKHCRKLCPQGYNPKGQFLPQKDTCSINNCTFRSIIALFHRLWVPKYLTLLNPARLQWADDSIICVSEPGKTA